MPTFIEALPERKASHYPGIRWTPAEDGGPIAGLLIIGTGRTDAAYTVEQFPTTWPGSAYHLAKLAGGSDPTEESYSVFCARRGPEGDSCDCKGFTFKGVCKHTDAVRALLDNRWL
jgi:hypothetical protein